MFSACQSRPEFPGVAAALEAAGALRIELIDPSYQGEPVASGESLIYSDLPAEFLRQYVEISPERLQKLSPSLTSCDGLTEVGRLNHAGQTTERMVNNQSQIVTIPQVAYAYPDSNYPDLIVIFLEGKSVILEASKSEQ